MSINTTQQFEQASIYSDLNSLNAIRKMGQTDQTAALNKAAKEFEAFFLNLMLKSMRQASEVIGENSMLSSPQEKMYTGMLDEQMSVDLSQKGLLGIADLMMTQLSQTHSVSDNNGEAVKNRQNFDNVRTIGASRRHNPDKVNLIKPVEVTPTKIDPKVLLKQASEQQKDLKIIAPISLDRQPEPGLKIERPHVNSVEVVADVQPTKVKAEKKPLFKKVGEFVSTLLPHAKEAAQKIGLDPRLLIAQAALETGWGKFVMHDESGQPGFNLFGIKAGKNWNGDSIHINTLEVEGQQFKKVNASFRKYQSFSESFDDYVNFITQNPRYQKAVDTTHNAKQYIKELQTSGYATDPDYAKKIIEIYQEDLIHTSDIGTK